jgi:hypothetical protein
MFSRLVDGNKFSLYIITQFETTEMWIVCPHVILGVQERAFSHFASDLFYNVSKRGTVTELHDTADNKRTFMSLYTPFNLWGCGEGGRMLHVGTKL